MPMRHGDQNAFGNMQVIPSELSTYSNAYVFNNAEVVIYS
jgi:hypothetical protein